MADLIAALLADQSQLTAVERFADHGHAGARYVDRIPLVAPQSGQQYAFEVDLDACTGCKACVTGCHNLNDLDDGEVWRTVGLLHGGTTAQPVQQTVTTSCHHCLEPACMYGCPVRAYEKDPITGIVKHLDDQCIGCQYCIFMCPYDAPKYNARRGIVRKCDMCASRLAESQAPACVEACPNGAIEIRIVDHDQAVAAAEAAAFLPGAAPPGDTIPSTVYRTERAAARHLLPADYYQITPAHAHPALVALLVLSQWAVGAACVRANPWLVFAIASAALGASLFHLGRPLHAYRAWLGLRTSWLSREIVLFSLFLPSVRVPWLAAAVGTAALGCSIMVYASTKRACWSTAITGFKFIMTAAVLGLATARLVLPFTIALACKLAIEAAALRHVWDRRHSAHKRSAILMTQPLSSFTAARFACGALAIGLMQFRSAYVLALGLCLCGELLERHLFFAAATAPRMPGAPA